MAGSLAQPVGTAAPGSAAVGAPMTTTVEEVLAAMERVVATLAEIRALHCRVDAPYPHPAFLAKSGRCHLCVDVSDAFAFPCATRRKANAALDALAGCQPTLTALLAVAKAAQAVSVHQGRTEWLALDDALDALTRLPQGAGGE